MDNKRPPREGAAAVCGACVAAAGRKTRAGVKRLLFGAFRVKMACNVYNVYNV